MNFKYGWRADLPDPRDWYYANVHSPLAMFKKHSEKLGIIVNPNITIDHPIIPVTPPSANPVGIGSDGLPLSVDLRNEKMPPVYDQKNLGSCVANSSEAMFTYVHGGGPFSRLQLYYEARLKEGNPTSDCGCMNRTAISVLADMGTGTEASWPYIESNFAVAPPAIELQEAAQNKATEYSRLVSRQDFRTCLAQGFPFNVGLTLFSSFESDETARSFVIPMPKYGEQMLGGHSTLICGYISDYKGLGEHYIMRNSWSSNWADNGYAYLPAAYIEPTTNSENLANDCWTIRRTT